MLAGARAAGPPSTREELPFLRPPEKPGHIGRLGHYGVIDVLGRGGMGVVLKAFDESLQRMVAIKVLAPHVATSAAARQRFMREARAAATAHEHVVAIHAVAEDGGVPYIVMQLVVGMSLQERLDADGPLGVREVLRIGAQTAAGLAAAHAQGVVHRDVKPGNILLENGVERVKLTDFGLARAADDANLTQSGVVAGTPQYMAPEQARGETVDHRADLFSLGSVLYAALAGRSPFRAGTLHAVLRRVTDDTPRPLREVNPDVPGWLVELIGRLHTKDPAARPQTAAEVAAELERGLAAAQLPAPAMVAPAPQPPTPRRARPTRRLAGAAAGVAVVAATVAPAPAAPAVPAGLPVTFVPAQADHVRQEWAAHLGRPGRTTNSLRMQLVLIPPGEFDMGSTEEEVAAEITQETNATSAYIEHLRMEIPRRRVRLTRPFLMATREVTVKQFRAYTEATKAADPLGGFGLSGKQWTLGPKYGWTNVGYPLTDQYPVVNVSWGDAQSFCAWLSRAEGRRYRLPTEAEWEYACRAGTEGRVFWEGRQAAEYAVRRLNSDGKTQVVGGGRKPNPFGLFDMCGNAAEWVADWYKPYRPKDVGDPTGDPSGSEHVVRGGSAGTNVQRAVCTLFRGTVAWRDKGASTEKVVGFRVVCEP